MRYSQAKQFNTDWEYEQIKRQERKQTKQVRNQRRNRRSLWESQDQITGGQLKMKMYDYENAKKLVQKYSDTLEVACLGMAEDWFWTAEEIYADGRFVYDLSEKPEIGGICGSSWATPSLYLKFKDGREEIMDCCIGESTGEIPEWFSYGELSRPVQEFVESLKTPKLEYKVD